MIHIKPGDCREVIKGLPDGSVHAVVTDPPYSLVSIQKRFGKPGSAPARSEGATGVYQRASSGFMGQQWDTGEVAFDPAFWVEVLRVLRPGGHLLAFGGTRTYHRLTCAIEDAGFEIRDTLCWLYGSGFPKSHNVGKAIDKAAGAERIEVLGVKPGHEDFVYRTDAHAAGGRSDGWDRPWRDDPDAVRKSHMQMAPTTPEAAAWEGWGTALKPAFEPIVLARKPLEGTVAENVLKHGTGAINIDGCRVEASGRPARECIGDLPSYGIYGEGIHGSRAVGTTDLGRWPANVCHDGSDEVVAMFPRSKGQQGDIKGTEPSHTGQNGIYGKFGRRVPFNKRVGEATAEKRYTEDVATNFAALSGARRSDAGSAARFFYSAKADKEDRWGSKHPTVKPIELMRWLVRLVTPMGGVVLDPFAGSGSTGVAAIAEGVDAILIEREARFIADIQERIGFYEGRGRHSKVAKARHTSPKGEMPLFGEQGRRP